MKTRIFGVGVILLAVTLVALPVRADSVKRDIDFSGSGTSASDSVSFTTAVGDALTVTGDPVQNLTATPESKGSTLPITDGALSFTTGGCMTGCFTNVGGTKGSPTYMTNATFGFGGSLTIVGEIAGMSSPETLLTGTFGAGLNSAGKLGSATPFAHMSSTGTGSFSGSLDITYINSEIYNDFAALGILFSNPYSSGKSYLSEMTIDLLFSPTGVTSIHQDTGIWNGQVTSSDTLVMPVPEPSSLLLIGSALFVGAWIIRRKLNVSVPQ